MGQVKLDQLGQGLATEGPAGADQRVVAAEPAAGQAAAHTAGQLGRKGQAQFVDQLSGGQAGVQRGPALSQDVVDTSFPEGFQC